MSEGTEKLLEFSQSFKKEYKKKDNIEEWRSYDIEKRIEYALVEGIDEYIDKDAEEARSKSKKCNRCY